MRKMITRLAACFALTAAASTQALPIVQADAFAVGDNKAALETSTGLVWMDFGVTVDESYSEVVSKLDTKYKGWRLPTGSEVTHLWNSLFSAMPGWYVYPTISFLDQPNLDQEFEDIFNILGYGKDSTHIVTNMNTGDVDTWKSKSAYGVFKYESGEFGWVRMSEPYDNIHNDDSVLLHLNVDASDWYGTLLVKSEAPEPSTLMLLTLGLLGLGFVRRTAK
jgi:hypothetical protein